MSHRCFIPNTCTETSFQSETQDGNSRLRKTSVTQFNIQFDHKAKIATYVSCSMNTLYFVFTPLYSWEPNTSVDI